QLAHNRLVPSSAFATVDFPKEGPEIWCFTWLVALALSIALDTGLLWRLRGFCRPVTPHPPPVKTGIYVGDRAMNHATPLTARRGAPLNGRARVPGDKSISLRALILGAMAVGETKITGMLEGEDALSTANAMRALGATVERTGEASWRVLGVGVGGFAEAKAPLDFGNSGTGCRLAMGAVAGCPITATFDGDASLRKRPMRRILDPLQLMGARTLSVTDSERLPAVLQGARDPIPISYEAPVP